MRALLFALAALFALAPAARAERFTLTYDGLGLGVVPLGEVTVDIGVYDDSYRASAHLISGGLLNLFERTNLRAVSAGEIENGAVAWRSYMLDHYYSHKHRVIVMDHGPGGVATRIEPNYRIWGEPPASDADRRRSRDPLSSVVAMAVDVAQTRRCSGVYPTFDGRFHYLLELGGGDIDEVDIGPYEGPVLKCSLAYIAVSGFEPRDAGRRRIPQGQAWFALMEDASFAPPVRISTPLSAGGAVIRLASLRRSQVEVLPETATPTAATP